MKLLIYGSGGGGREALYLAKLINKEGKRWEQIIFIDDSTPFVEKYGCQCYPFEYIIEHFSPADTEVHIAVGEPYYRKVLWEKVQSAGYSFATIIHPSAVIMDRVTIGKGVLIRGNAVISCDAVLEDNTIINSLCVVGHDAVIGKHSFMSAQSMVAANGVVGEGVFIGLQAGIREKIHIGNESIISMGSCVLRDVPEGVVVMGNPARVIQKNEEKKIFK